MLRIAYRSIITCLLLAGVVWARPEIYEPFADTNATLTGNTPGEGLSGTWSGSTGFIVNPESLSWGLLVTGENQAEATSAGSITATLGTELGDAGLLDHGSNLWFSMVIDSPASGGTNPDTGFAIGTATVSSGNNLPMSGQGIGWNLKNNVLQAAYWNGGDVQRQGGSSLGNNVLVFIVGEINWGADTNALDVIKLYRPDTELIQGSVLSTHSAVLDQSTFDRISFGLKNNTSFEFDEIRFGATYEDVAVLPPPTGTVIQLY